MRMRRVAIDSRYRDYPEQDTQRDFDYALNIYVSCPAGTTLYVVYVQTPNTVNTIEASMIRNLFWASNAAGEGPPTLNSQSSS